MSLTSNIKNNFESPVIAIGFPFHKNDDALKISLSSLTKIQYPKHRIQLIFLDNSDDGATATVEHWINIHDGYLDQEVFRLVGNRPHLRNAIIKKAKADYLLFIDSDVEVPPESISNLLQHFDDDSVFIASIPPVDLVDPSFLFFPEKYAKDTGGAVSETRTVWFGCTMIRLSHVEKVGLMDESWILKNEDGAYCLQAIAKGFKVIQDTTTWCKHHRRYSTYSSIRDALMDQDEPIKLQIRYGWSGKWVRRFLFWNLYFFSIPIAFLWSPILFQILTLFIFLLNSVKMRGIGKLIAPISGIINSFIMLIGTYFGFCKINYDGFKKRVRIENVTS